MSGQASGKLSCRECSDFLADYREGTLDAAVRETFELHLNKCGNCREYLAQYELAISTSQRACAKETADAGDTFPEELVRAILAARRDSR